MATPATPFRAELGGMLRLAAPLALANLLQMAVYAVDVIFVARLGQEALAAASLSTSLFRLMMWCFSGLTGAVAPLIAAELGRMKHAVREVRRSVRMALWLSVLCGLGGMLVCQFGEAIMLAAGQDPHVARLAGSFMALLCWSMIPQIACNVLRTFIAALGRPVFATAITALAIMVNALATMLSSSAISAHQRWACKAPHCQPSWSRWLRLPPIALRSGLIADCAAIAYSDAGGAASGRACARSSDSARR